MPDFAYVEVPDTDPKDVPEHVYTVVPPTDEDGKPVHPKAAGKSASGDKRGAAADSKEK